MKRFCKKCAASLFAFAVKNVPKGRDRIIVTEVRLEQVAFYECEAVGQAESGGHIASDGDNFRPVDRGDVHPLRTLCQSDTRLQSPRIGCRDDANGDLAVKMMNDFAPHLGRIEGVLERIWVVLIHHVTTWAMVARERPNRLDRLNDAVDVRIVRDVKRMAPIGGIHLPTIEQARCVWPD